MTQGKALPWRSPSPSLSPPLLQPLDPENRYRPVKSEAAYSADDSGADEGEGAARSPEAAHPRAADLFRRLFPFPWPRSAPSAATDRGHSSNQPGLASQSPGGSVSHRPEPSDSSLLSA